MKAVTSKVGGVVQILHMCTPVGTINYVSDSDSELPHSIRHLTLEFVLSFPDRATNVKAVPVQARASWYSFFLALAQKSPHSLFSGESAVGKSRYGATSRRRFTYRRSCDSLVLRFVKDQFDDYRESTIGGMLFLSLPSNIRFSPAFLQLRS